MTDDTDTPEREAAERAVSLPLLDTYAALAHELAAKEDRIERLESELAADYLEPATTADPAVAADGEGAEPSEPEPRSHEDWEPETDPLNDTGAADADGDHEGVTAEVPGAEASTMAESGGRDGEEPSAVEPEAVSESQAASGPETAEESSGLQPVRTAGATDADSSTAGSAAGSTEEAAEKSVPERSREPATEAAGGEFGVTMETSSNLTGGSLGSSAGARSAASEASTSDDDREVTPNRPDPTADRGERLSLLVRRAELRDEGSVVETFVRGIDAFDDVTREMLAHYREAGDAAPVDAHVAAGGSGERQYAYARNRTLRKAGVIEHDGAGRYRYALPDLVEEAFDGNADGETLADAVAAVESATELA